MAQEYPATPAPQEPQRRRNTSTIIIIIVVVLLLCCCVLAALVWGLWTYGDQIFGFEQTLVNLLL